LVVVIAEAVLVVVVVVIIKVIVIYIVTKEFLNIVAENISENDILSKF
jgi:hypothetical protein